VRPLLHEDADWDALADGLHRLCADLDDAGAVRLLTVLADAEPEPETAALAELVARRLAAHWRGRVLSVDALAAWSAVASRLPRRPEPPSAAATWISLEPGHAPATPVELERFADWLRLAELLARHDPELLAGLGFPERHREVLEAFAADSPGGEPPLEQELRQQALERVAELYPSCAARASAGALAARVDAILSTELLPDAPQPALAPRFPVRRVLRDLVE
jgi:hypothetical protein